MFINVSTTPADIKKRPHEIKKIKTFKTLKESIETCAGVKTR